jgi:GntR family transcriptional repressor for pyruvate dehydrogenase complex
MTNLRAIDHTKVYNSIIDQLIESIRSGEFAPGTALPPERTLAKILGVSRHSVREAIRILEHAGVVTVRVGSGTFVTNAAQSKAAVVRARTLVSGNPSPLDIMVVRCTIEPRAAFEAAHSGDDDDIRALQESFDEHEGLIADGTDPLHADYSFHVAVARTTRNPVLLMVVEELAKLMQQAAQEDFQQRLHNRPGSWTRYLAEHRIVLDAILRRDPPAAAEAMQAHLDEVLLDLSREVD